MSASVHTLPIWKKDSTAAEWLEELAGLARENPAKWGRMVVVFEEFNSEKLPTKLRQYSWGHESNTGILGSLQAAILDVWEYMKNRQ